MGAERARASGLLFSLASRAAGLDFLSCFQARLRSASGEPGLGGAQSQHAKKIEERQKLGLIAGQHCRSPPTRIFSQKGLLRIDCWFPVGFPSNQTCRVPHVATTPTHLRRFRFHNNDYKSVYDCVLFALKGKQPQADLREHLSNKSKLRKIVLNYLPLELFHDLLMMLCPIFSQQSPMLPLNPWAFSGKSPPPPPPIPGPRLPPPPPRSVLYRSKRPRRIGARPAFPGASSCQTARPKSESDRDTADLRFVQGGAQGP